MIDVNNKQTMFLEEHQIDSLFALMYYLKILFPEYDLIDSL